MKRQWGFDHVLVKGKERVMGEVSLVFTAYNITRVLAVVGGIDGIKALINGILTGFKYLLGPVSEYISVTEQNLAGNNFCARFAIRWFTTCRTGLIPYI